MTRSVSKSRTLCIALFFTLMVTAGFVFMCDSSPHSGVLTVSAQTSQASANTTVVTNSLKVTTGSISLGSTLQATGKVTAGGKPLANAPVSLHLGDVKVANTQTNANGEYSFNEPIGLYYFPAALSNGATIYTVVEPRDGSFVSTPSVVTTVSVDLLPLSLSIFVIIAVILIGLYVFMRRKRGKAVLGFLGKWRATSAAETKVQAESSLSGAEPLEQGPTIVSEIPPGDSTVKEPHKSPEATLPAGTVAPLVDEPQRDAAVHQPEPELPESVDETGVLKQALDFFERGNDRQAISMLYDAAIIDVATTHEVKIASHATYWEKYHTIEAAVPEIQEPLLKLTDVYELANYSGRALTEEQRDEAVDAFRAIKAHLESTNT